MRIVQLLLFVICLEKCFVWKSRKDALDAKGIAFLHTSLEKPHPFFGLPRCIFTRTCCKTTIYPVELCGVRTLQRNTWVTNLTPSIEVLALKEVPPSLLLKVCHSAELLNVACALTFAMRTVNTETWL